MSGFPIVGGGGGGGGGGGCHPPYPTIFFENPPIKTDAPPSWSTPPPQLEMKPSIWKTTQNIFVKYDDVVLGNMCLCIFNFFLIIKKDKPKL